MIPAIVAVLVGSAASGLAFIAYRHPKGYARIFGPACWALNLVVAGISIWNAALSIAALAITQARVVPSDRWNEANAAIDAYQIPLMLVFACWAASQVFLAFLRFLPDILADDDAQGGS